MNCCIKSTGISVSNIRTKIEVPEQTFLNGCKYKVIVNENIPRDGLGLPLFILNGDTRIPIWQTNCARSMMTPQIFQLCTDSTPCNKTYCLSLEYVSTGLSMNPDHFTILRRIKPVCP